MICLAEAGGDGLAMAKEIYASDLEHVDELCGPYLSVIDIDRARLPATTTVSSWAPKQFVAALRHDPTCEQFNPHLRQLLHVGYKIAAQKNGQFLNLVKRHQSFIAKNVTDNIFNRHLKPLFLGN